MPARKSVRRGAKKSVRRGAKKSRVKLISDILSSKYGVQSDSKSDKPKKKKSTKKRSNKKKSTPKKEKSSQIDYAKFWRVSSLDESDRVNLEIDLQAMIPISQLSVKYDLPHNQIQSYCDYKGFKRRKK